MRNRSGFTVVEMLIVVTVGVILMSIAMNAMSTYQNGTAVRQARNVFLSMHARARAQAIEYGQNTMLNVDPDGDSVWISRNDSSLSVVRIMSEFGVDIEGEDVGTVCMTSRGFADSRCNSFGENTLVVQFTQGERTLTVSVLPLGQALY